MLQSPVRRGTAGGSLANRSCAAHGWLLFSRRSRPSRLVLRQNGPEPSRARRFLEKSGQRSRDSNQLHSFQGRSTVPVSNLLCQPSPAQPA